jgi:hypothetical protein
MHLTVAVCLVVCKDIPYYSPPNVHIYGLLAEQCMLFSYVPFGVVVKVPDCPDSLHGGGG